MTKAEKVYAVVARQVARLAVDTPQTRADLAKLRRAVGKDLADSPEVWEIVMSDTTVDCEVQGEITKEGKAIHTALTLYGVYRQGNSAGSQRGLSFGRALAALAAQGELSYNSIRKRYNSLITSKDITRLAYFARSFIRALSKAGIKLDFAQFAKDLYNYQFSTGNKAVRIRWSSEFYSNSISRESGGVSEEGGLDDER